MEEIEAITFLNLATESWMLCADSYVRVITYFSVILILHLVSEERDVEVCGCYREENMPCATVTQLAPDSAKPLPVPSGPLPLFSGARLGQSCSVPTAATHTQQLASSR